MKPKEQSQIANEGPVTEDEISKIVSKMKNNKAARPNKLFPIMVK